MSFQSFSLFNTSFSNRAVCKLAEFRDDGYVDGGAKKVFRIVVSEIGFVFLPFAAFIETIVRVFISALLFLVSPLLSGDTLADRCCVQTIQDSLIAGVVSLYLIGRNLDFTQEIAES